MKYITSGGNVFQVKAIVGSTIYLEDGVITNRDVLVTRLAHLESERESILSLLSRMDDNVNITTQLFGHTFFKTEDGEWMGTFFDDTFVVAGAIF